MRIIDRYITRQTYLILAFRGELTNPDQRISEDIRSFTSTTLSFFLMLLNGTFTVLAFAGVLWSITPALLIVAVLYALAGTTLTVFFGKSLVRLNYDQLDKEANLRSNLIHVREHAESIALLRREGRIRERLMLQLREAVTNFKRIIAVQRNLGFFTTGYNWLIQLIPVAIVAPMFIRGQAEFGVVPQSIMAFGHLLGAFSLIVTQFQSISTFAAVVTRLGGLAEALDSARADKPVIEIVEEPNDIAFENLSLYTTHERRPLVRCLSAKVEAGMRVFLTGRDEECKLALFRATAGIWHAGEGRIRRPDLDHIFFLPERPYLPPGTLRGALVRTGREKEITDDQIMESAKALGADDAIKRAGGLDAERHWDDEFSLGEQQLLAVVRLLLANPKFAFLDRPGAVLDRNHVERILAMLQERGIGLMMIGDPHDKPKDFDVILEIGGDGSWNWYRLGEPAGRVPLPEGGSSKR